MKRTSMRLVCLIAVSALSVGLGAPVNSQPRPSTDQESRLNRLASAAQDAQAQSAMELHNFSLVGHNDLAGFGRNIRDYGDVWGHRDAAYVGSRCGASGNGGAGVRVVDISRPSRPVLVSVLNNPRFSRAEDVVVRGVDTPAFSGDLAAVGIQQCFDADGEASFTGLKFFDVTDPAHPVHLSNWKLPKHSIGCHEIDLAERPDGRVLAGCARNLIDQAFGEPKQPGVHFVDVTDPRHPRQISTFSLNVDPFSGDGCEPLKFDHSVRFEHRGRLAYLSYWDAGTVLLDISHPGRPRFVGKTKIVPPDEDGDNHSMTLANGGKWLVINPEDFSPFDPHCARFDGYGEAYVYDNSDPAHTRFLGSFATPNTHSTNTNGAFTVHNTEVVNGRQFFSSWYSDGVVWWTMNGVGASKMLGQFLPPGFPLVWGVYPDRRHDVILASDFTTGLWIVRPRGLGDF